MVRVLGLDIGEERIGVAVSDPGGRVATPLEVVAGPVGRGLVRLAEIVDEYEVARVVVGLPTSMDGSEGPQARRVREQAEELARCLPVPVSFADERLSTVVARRAMTEAGVKDRKKRGKLDMLAAAVVLQGYLDAEGQSDTDD